MDFQSIIGSFIELEELLKTNNIDHSLRNTLCKLSKKIKELKIRLFRPIESSILHNGLFSFVALNEDGTSRLICEEVFYNTLSKGVYGINPSENMTLAVQIGKSITNSAKRQRGLKINPSILEVSSGMLGDYHYYRLPTENIIDISLPLSKEDSENTLMSDGTSLFECFEKLRDIKKCEFEDYCIQKNGGTSQQAFFEYVNLWKDTDVKHFWELSKQLKILLNQQNVGYPFLRLSIRPSTPKLPISQLNKEERYLKEYANTFVRQIFNPIIGYLPSDYNALHLKALSYERQGDLAKADECWFRLALLKFSERNLTDMLCPIDNGRKVSKVKDLHLDRHIAKLALATDFSLLEESKLTNLLQENSEDPDIFSHVAGYMGDYGGYNYLLLRRSEGQTYHDCIEFAKRKNLSKNHLNEFKKLLAMNALRSLVHLQSIYRLNKHNLGQRGIKLENLVLENKLGAVLLDSGFSSKEQINALNLIKAYNPAILTLCQGDLHPGNIINVERTNKGIVSYNRACLIDFGKAHLGGYLYDVAYLLEQEELGFSNNDKKELLHYFIEQLSLQGISIRNPDREYAFNALVLDLYASACFSGQKLKQKYSEAICKERAEWYLSNAKQAFEILIN